MQNPKTYYAALSRLDNGENPQEVADSLNVSYATVLRWYREYKAAREKGELDKLLDMDKLIIAETVAGIEAPAMLKEEALANFTDKLNGLELLRESLNSAALYLVNRIKSRAGTIEHTSELIELTNGLCAIQNAFFNSNKTQVNVQNNYTQPGEQKYGAYLSDTPVE